MAKTEILNNEAEHYDDMLFYYAKGQLNQKLSTMVDVHMDLKPEVNSNIIHLENLLGLGIDEQSPCDVKNKSDILEAIFENSYTSKVVESSNNQNHVNVETITSKHLRQNFSDLNWQSLLPGIREAVISDDKDGKMALIWIKAGHKIPHHTHGGSEYTLVLQGSFKDGKNHYMKGDLAIADEHTDHRPVADIDEDCICLTITDAPLKLTGPIGRFVQHFIN